jgi:hypothetical protein
VFFFMLLACVVEISLEINASHSSCLFNHGLNIVSILLTRHLYISFSQKSMCFNNTFVKGHFLSLSTGLLQWLNMKKSSAQN